jgi:signal transduction histidine kinase
LQLNMQERKNLYLIFKEVIHNASKYSSCQNVSVALQYAQGVLVMDIRDDGVGFDTQPFKEDAWKTEGGQFANSMGGNGIQNMQQRASELNGKLEISSSPGQGTRVTLTFAI